VPAELSWLHLHIKIIFFDVQKHKSLQILCDALQWMHHFLLNKAMSMPVFTYLNFQHYNHKRVKTTFAET
jgi:hypothetical protein